MRDALQLFQKISIELLQEEAKEPVARHIPSSNLFQTLNLDLKEEPITDENFEEILRALILATPRTATAGFFNQLFGGRNDKAILGELLAVMLNNSMYTFKAGGAQIGVEKILLREVCELIGWDTKSDGTLAPGGSMTNLMAMIMARDQAQEQARATGIQEKLMVYTSAESHYSIPKNASFCGIGRDHVRYVPTDLQGRLIPSALEEMIVADIQNGYTPALVNLTAGTTVLGAFDPILSTQEICNKYNIWLHVDGAYCGAVLFSKRFKHLIDGIEKVDSFSFNAHKMLGTPLSCSLIVVKNKKHLYDSFSNDASYLYQTDQDDFNPGKTSLQCGRRNDALKFWTLWKSVGTKGLEAIVDTQFELADIARDYIRNNSDYTLYSFDESIGVCFNYKDIPARDICTLLYEHAELMVGYGSFNGTEFIRLVTINAQNTSRDILNFFKTMEEFIATKAHLFENSTT